MHGIQFFQADAMFTGYGTAQIYTCLHDFPAGFFNQMQVIRISGIKKNQRM